LTRRAGLRYATDLAKPKCTEMTTGESSLISTMNITRMLAKSSQTKKNVSYNRNNVKKESTA
jgi:hypothetical protein